MPNSATSDVGSSLDLHKGIVLCPTLSSGGLNPGLTTQPLRVHCFIARRARGRSFRRIHHTAAILGISTFAYLLSGAILIWVPDGVKVTERSAEVSKKIALFTELLREKAGVMRMVTVLTTVQRKSGGNVNVLDIEEDDGVDD
ncbi:hypothetical protein GGX14DRAFT_389160 [Mycena pura]|uniref:Transmembrane protein n=1 Tax=Mycena pura TaxID=153505 RepID=A0AAD6YK22_9AGAR|nr:hypothetical protein GGX14DRAFT_389160 [Mycena pura]